MSELSRVEDLLKTGVEEPVLPMSRLEAILRGEKITPQSRVEELLLQYNPSDILIEKRITANGTYFAVNDNADGYFKVVVDTPVVPPTVLDHLIETITTNGLHEYTPTHDGFDTAAITVAVPIPPEKILGTKTITENDTYDASDDSTEVTVTLDNPSIPDNNFIHVDILDIADVTKIVGKVRYTNASTDRAFTVDISNIPTYIPSGSNPYRNMYRFDLYNAYVGLYISKDATGIFLYNMNEGWVRPVIYEFGYNVTKQLDGYSQVTVNVQSGNTASIQLECTNLDNETVTITSFDKSETYTETVSGARDTITFNNLTYSGVWYVTNSANQDIVEIDNSVVTGEVINGTNLMPYIDQIRINDYGSAGTLANNIFTFNVSETRDDWSSNTIVNNMSAIDMTSIDHVYVDVTITSQVDYGYVYVLFSDTAYTWGGYQWPSLMYNVDAAIKIDSSGRYTIDTSNISGNQYIYLAATTGKVSVTKGDCDNSKNGTIIGSITGLVAYNS